MRYASTRNDFPRRCSHLPQRPRKGSALGSQQELTHSLRNSKCGSSLPKRLSLSWKPSATSRRSPLVWHNVHDQPSRIWSSASLRKLGRTSRSSRMASSGASWPRDGSARRCSKSSILRSTWLRSASSATNHPIPRRWSSRSGAPPRSYPTINKHAPFRPFA